MIAGYRSLLKSHQQLLNKSKALSERERNMLKPAIKTIEKQMETLAKQIAEEAGKRYPTYSRLVDELEKQTLFKVWKTCKEETRGRQTIPAQQG